MSKQGLIQKHAGTHTTPDIRLWEVHFLALAGVLLVSSSFRVPSLGILKSSSCRLPMNSHNKPENVTS